MLLRSGKPVEISFTGHLCVLTLRPWQPDASSLCASRDTRRSDFPSPPPPADKSTCFGVSCFASTLSPKALVYPFHLLDPSPEGWPFWSFPYSHSPEGAAIRDLPILPDSIGLLNVWSTNLAVDSRSRYFKTPCYVLTNRVDRLDW